MNTALLTRERDMSEQEKSILRLALRNFAERCERDAELSARAGDRETSDACLHTAGAARMLAVKLGLGVPL